MALKELKRTVWEELGALEEEANEEIQRMEQPKQEDKEG